MRNKKYDIPILAIVIVLVFSWAYGANYIIHDFTTGKMHEAKDVYRTNGRSVENDIDSIEVKIPTGGFADATDLSTHIADTTTAHGETSENVASRIVTRDASGNFKVGTITGTLSGNASTATQLATPRTIAGTSFDGTANISISHTGLTDKGTLTHAQVETELTRLEADKADTGAVALKANTADVYNTAAVDLLLNAKLDAALITGYYTKSATYNTGEIAALLAAKANTADVYDTAAINLLLADKADTSSVTAVSDLLAAHTSEVSGAHQGSAIAVDSSGFTGNLSLADNTAQKAFAKLDALSGLPATNAITKIYGDSDVDGCETGAVWLVGTNGVQIGRTNNTFEVNIDGATKFDSYYTKAETDSTLETNFYTKAETDSTLETNFYNKTQTDDTIAAAIAAIPTGGGIAIEDEGTYISGNTIWEFDTEYDTTAVMIFRNRLIQPRKLFTSSVVSSKTRVTFLSAINASDEIILISNK